MPFMWEHFFYLVTCFHSEQLSSFACSNTKQTITLVHFHMWLGAFEVTMRFYIRSVFLNQWSIKASQTHWYLPNCWSFWSWKNTKRLFNFEQKQFGRCGELMSLNEPSECCDQRTLSPCSVNYSSVQWSTCTRLLGNLLSTVCWFNVVNIG